MKWVTVDKKMQINGTVGGSAEIDVPPEVRKAYKAKVSFDAIIADTSIVGGESLAGLVQTCWSGSKQDPNFEFERDDLADLVLVSNVGRADTGVIDDSIPVNATLVTRYAVINGPFDYTRYENPKIFLQMYPVTTEYASATDAQIAVTWEFLVPEETDPPIDTTYVIRKAFSASSPQHRIPVPVKKLFGVYVKSGTAGVVTKFKVNEAFDVPNPLLAHHTYTDLKVVAASATPSSFMVLPVTKDPGGSRDLELSASAATTITAWFVGQVKHAKPHR